MKSEISDQITIIVPTRNRHSFLRRLLKHYISCGAPMAMRILDSSDVKPRFEFESENLVNSPKITHIMVDPSTSLFTKLVAGLQGINTPYTVFWADDDFLVPSTIKHCVNFLDEHSDYSAAQGQAGIFVTKTTETGKAISRLGPYLQTSIIGATGAERLCAWFAGGGTVFYSVQRTNHLKSRLLVWKQYDPSPFFSEIIHGGLTVIQGKVKKLDQLYMMREIHAEQVAATQALAGDFFDFITNENFANEYGKFCSCLSQSLTQQDHIDLQEANGIIKQAFWSYLAKNLSKKWQAKYIAGEQSSRRSIRNLVKMVPGSRWLWAHTSKLLPGHKMSLPALLSTRSPYYDDFMPMYDAVKNESRDSKTEAGQRRTNYA